MARSVEQPAADVLISGWHHAWAVRHIRSLSLLGYVPVRSDRFCVSTMGTGLLIRKRGEEQVMIETGRDALTGGCLAS
jgi:hypothetical protein